MIIQHPITVDYPMYFIYEKSLFQEKRDKTINQSNKKAEAKKMHYISKTQKTGMGQ